MNSVLYYRNQLFCFLLLFSTTFKRMMLKPYNDIILGVDFYVAYVPV